MLPELFAHVKIVKEAERNINSDMDAVVAPFSLPVNDIKSVVK